MTTLPDWAHDGVDPGGDWLLIVCTGGRGGLSHEFEPIGLYYDTGPHPIFPVARPHEWGFLPRPRYGSGTTTVEGAYIERTAADPGMSQIEQGWALSTMTARTAIGRIGSITTSCPACSRTHRVERLDWFRFLDATRRGDETPWADVARLD